jgi:hypothetical protein
MTTRRQRLERRKARHNAHVKRQFERAKQGEIINLSDLMGEHEDIIVEEWEIRKEERKKHTS